jgi:hypothetical protein
MNDTFAVQDLANYTNTPEGRMGLVALMNEHDQLVNRLRETYSLYRQWMEAYADDTAECKRLDNQHAVLLQKLYTDFFESEEHVPKW